MLGATRSGSRGESFLIFSSCLVVVSIRGIPSFGSHSLLASHGLLLSVTSTISKLSSLYKDTSHWIYSLL